MVSSTILLDPLPSYQYGATQRLADTHDFKNTSGQQHRFRTRRYSGTGFLSCIPDDRIKGLDFKHGISFFHDLKYPANFTHLDYLNPDAPKGGTIVEATALDFNTLSPASTGAVGAPGFFGLINDTLIIRAGDEVSGF